MLHDLQFILARMIGKSIRRSLFYILNFFTNSFKFKD